MPEIRRHRKGEMQRERERERKSEIFMDSEFMNSECRGYFLRNVVRPNEK
jgi:hypothetical protein